MRLSQFLACCVLVLCLHGGTALKCRTGEHQTNNQFQKVMHRCRDRIIQGNQRVGGDNSSDDDSDDEDSYDDESIDSDEKDYDKKFMNSRTGTTDTSMMRNSGSNNNNGDQKSNARRYEQNTSSRPYPYNRVMSNASSTGADVNNDRHSRYNTTLRSGGSNNMANSGHNVMQTNQHDQACIVQCFFDELNLNNLCPPSSYHHTRYCLRRYSPSPICYYIDQNGFPEKSAVTKIMMQNVRDQELQDFVEETVIDCFYLIDADRNKEPCKFSQNLLNCLADKGRARCEDWDSQ